MLINITWSQNSWPSSYGFNPDVLQRWYFFYCPVRVTSRNITETLSGGRGHDAEAAEAGADLHLTNEKRVLALLTNERRVLTSSKLLLRSGPGWWPIIPSSTSTYSSCSSSLSPRLKLIMSSCPMHSFHFSGPRSNSSSVKRHLSINCLVIFTDNG